MRALTKSVCGVALVLAGCTAGPDYVPPETAVPGAFRGDAVIAQPVAAPMTVAPDPAQPLPQLQPWWRRLDDPVLTELVERGLANNNDVRIALARLRQAVTQRDGASAQYLPTLNFTTSGQRRGLPEDAERRGDRAQSRNAFRVGVDASWELDMVGRRDRTFEAADAATLAAEASLADARLSLSGEMVRNYIQLRALQARLDVAERGVKTAGETLDATRRLQAEGATTRIVVIEAEAEYERARARVPVLRAAMQRTIHRISVLGGQAPSDRLDQLIERQPLPPAPALPELGLPSELLQRRPDLRRAERDLAAATARIGVAASEFYPRFNLTAGFGPQAAVLSSLPGALAYSIGAALLMPLFDGGRIRANIELAEARQVEAAVVFHQTLLVALQEVEGNLVGYQTEGERIDILNRALALAQESLRAADQRFQDGEISLFERFDIQRQFQSTDDDLIQAREAQLLSLVALVRALGGSW
ncbi:MAG: efflux transporter outer membrane subunit [Alphaproteobacteria bacterium]|nr:MAG: efflux transporter outer membrane subunit [Alphaproteobacteria bacterium]